MNDGLTGSKYFRFAIASSCQEIWGGCEELWAGAATFLSKAGHCVKIYKTNVDRDHQKIAKLEFVDCPVVELNNMPVSSKIMNRFLPHGRQYS